MPVSGPSANARLPSFAEALRVWLRIGCLSFGGPAGQIALLHREVVDERNWVSDRRFLHALNFCTLLPGPEAQQLAVYLGWLMHGAKGGVAAGLLFIIPGVLVMFALSAIYAAYGDVPLIAALFFGLKSAVLVLVVQALIRIGRRALKGWAAWTLAAVAFTALFFLAVPFPVVVLGAGLVGYLMPQRFASAAHGKAGDGPRAALDAVLAADPGYAGRLSRSARRAGLAATALWLLPVAMLLPVGGVFADVAWFFSKMAVVTFGGAYAVLAYVAQEAVQTYRWLSASEMLAGLGLAETTPGPLILVLQFVGFLAGYRAPGPISGFPGGTAAALLTVWVTFVPCFAFVFLGAPLVERLQDNRALSGALSAITAGVVGVIGNLAIWFGLHVLFREAVRLHAGLLTFDAPVLGSADPIALGLAFVAAVGLFRLKLGVPATLGICAILSAGLRLTFGL
jgi:chromate transporter